MSRQSGCKTTLERGAPSSKSSCPGTQEGLQAVEISSAQLCLLCEGAFGNAAFGCLRSKRDFCVWTNRIRSDSSHTFLHIIVTSLSAFCCLSALRVTSHFCREARSVGVHLTHETVATHKFLENLVEPFACRIQLMVMVRAVSTICSTPDAQDSRSSIHFEEETAAAPVE